MTKAGKLSIEFAEFKAEVEARLSALEDKKPTPKKPKGIVVDTVDDKIVATEE